MGKFDSIKVTNNQQQREFPPAGSFPARCVALVDLGHQQETYEGQSSWTPKIFLVFEICSKKYVQKDGRPYMVGEELTLSLNEKARLRARLEGWTARKLPANAEVNLNEMVKEPCTLTMVEAVSKSTGNKYSKISTIAQVMEDFVVPPATKPFFGWEIDEPDPVGGFPEWLPSVFGESLQDRVNGSQERNPGGAAGGAKSPQEVVAEQTAAFDEVDGRSGRFQPLTPEEVAAGGDSPF